VAAAAHDDFCFYSAVLLVSQDSANAGEDA
jgi:hypothetical protein